MSFCSTNFNVAKSKAFAWLSEFEFEIRANENFTIVVKEDKTNLKNAVFGPFAENYMRTVKKLKVKDYTYKHYKNRVLCGQRQTKNHF